MNDTQKIRILETLKKIVIEQNPDFLEEDTTGNLLILGVEEIIKDLKPHYGTDKL